jgi:predicted RNA polymerase sigma factor
VPSPVVDLNRAVALSMERDRALLLYRARALGPQHGSQHG